MHIQSAFLALAGLLCSAVLAAQCNQNNCLRALRNPSRSLSASAFCSAYIQSTVSVLTSTTQTIAAPGPVGATTTTTTTTLTSTIVSQLPDVSTSTTTTVTTTTTFTPLKKRDATPTYLSPCAGPSQISSACSCFISGRPATTLTSIVSFSTTSTAPGTTSTVTSTITSETDTTLTLPPTTTIVSVITATSTAVVAACPPNPPSQVVINPGFEDGGSSPWILGRSGSEVIFRLSYCGVEGPGRDCQVTSNGCYCIDLNADSPGGTGSLSQTLTNACLGKSYNFVAYLGRSDNIVPGSVGQSSITATLDGVTIFAPIFPCSPASPCPVAGGSGPYLKVGPIVVTPTRNSPVLTFTIATTINVNTFNLDVFIDDVTMTVI